MEMEWNLILSKKSDDQMAFSFETVQTICSCLICTAGKDWPEYEPILMYMDILNMEILTGIPVSLFSIYALS